MKRVPFFTLLCILCITKSLAQSVSGVILNAKTLEPCEFVTVSLQDVESNKVLSYSITKADGQFMLKHTSDSDSLQLNIKGMTINSLTIKVPSSAERLKILVEESEFTLNEVIIKAPKVRQTGDTIHYSVGQFIDITDHSIADVLRKLPNIQVLPSGKILYQNKPISKFYIEGLDMLDGKYGIATNNIRAEHIASVQVFENHQPIQVLKGIEIPEEAAINLRLKQNKLGAFFGSVQVGGGIPFPLLSNEVVGMRFSRNQQNMAVYKGDNTGRDLTGELVNLYYDAMATPNPFLSIVTPNPPDISLRRHLFNDAHTVAINNIFTLRNKFTLAINLSVLYDKQKQNSLSGIEIMTKDGQNIKIEESIASQLKKKELEGSVSLEGNNEAYYLSNRTFTSLKWNNEIGTLISDYQISQTLSLPTKVITNTFKYIPRTTRHNYELLSHLSFIDQENILYTTPSLFNPNDDPSNSLHEQYFGLKQFTTNTEVKARTRGTNNF